jgi:hypothetical protein
VSELRVRSIALIRVKAGIEFWARCASVRHWAPPSISVIPAEAGIHFAGASRVCQNWTPVSITAIPAEAGIHFAGASPVSELDPAFHHRHSRGGAALSGIFPPKSGKTL